MISFLQTMLVLIILGACGGGLDRETISIVNMLIIIGTSIFLLIGIDIYVKRDRCVLKRVAGNIADTQIILTWILAIKNISVKKMILIYKTRITGLFEKVVIK